MSRIEGHRLGKKFGQGRAKQVRASIRSRLKRLIQFSLELLEDRTLLSVIPTLNGGTLTVALTAANDTARISMLGPQVDIFFNGLDHNFSSVTSISVQGNASTGAEHLSRGSTATGRRDDHGLRAVILDGRWIEFRTAR